MTYRDNLGADGTPIQQSMTQDRHDYRAQNVDRLMLGVVLEVYPSDDEDGNRTAIRTLERRGHTHECTVLIIQDGTATYMRLPNVVITPDARAGIDDYQEFLPRGSTCLTTGEELNSALHQIDPYDLDGDWCVVGFIGGQLDRPFIIRWWPHARNTFDPATSGRGNPDANGEGRALEQQGRYFRRINGVETVVTSSGDIIISTTFAGGTIQPGEDPVQGRFSRSEVDEGGDIRVYMKRSRSVEWTWDPQPDGVGVLDSAEPELPQTNPQADGALTSGDHDDTYIVADQYRCSIKVPVTFEVLSQDKITLQAANEVEVFSDDVMTVQANNGIAIGVGELGPTSDASLQLSTNADTSYLATTTMTIQASEGVAIAAGLLGPTGGEIMRVTSEQGVDVLATTVLNLLAGGAVTLGGSQVVMGPTGGGGTPTGPGVLTGDSGGITLGEGGTDFLVKGTATATAWGAVVLPSDPTDLATALLAIKANTLAISLIISGLSLSGTSKTA